jgi:hypothetical protein
MTTQWRDDFCRVSYLDWRRRTAEGGWLPGLDMPMDNIGSRRAVDHGGRLVDLERRADEEGASSAVGDSITRQMPDE